MSLIAMNQQRVGSQTHPTLYCFGSVSSLSWTSGFSRKSSAKTTVCFPAKHQIENNQLLNEVKHSAAKDPDHFLYPRGWWPEIQLKININVALCLRSV